MAITIERSSVSCGAGGYETPVTGRKVSAYDMPRRANLMDHVHRVTQRYTLYVVKVDGRRVDSFLSKANAKAYVARRMAAE